MTYTVGSLFSGIGGLDLGLERAGMRVVWQSEIDPFACKVLKKHWPEVVNHGDIKQIDWATVEPVDIICGGYPCQPFSTAGKRRGTDDPRHLWPWVRTAISELRPKYAILENVRGHLSMGGLQVIGELAEIGYDAEWRVVSAAGVGAPHRRERIIIVAYPNSEFKHERGYIYGQEETRQGKAIQGSFNRSSSEMAYTDDHRCWQSTSAAQEKPKRWAKTAACKCGWWETEPDVGRVADGIPDRVDRLRGLGNAVVPQVAEYIGRLITTS
jgi:DNA (cytosine-5)-methyltransferase 1